MNLKIVTILILIIMVTVGFCGCNEEKVIDDLDSLDNDPSKPNYINVTVSAKAVFMKMISRGDTVEEDVYETVPGINVEIEMNKAGGVNMKFYDTTNSKGSTGYHWYTFKLYREQPINFYANLDGSHPIELSDYQISSGYHTITWEEVDALADIGDSIELPSVVLTMRATIPYI